MPKTLITLGNYRATIILAAINLIVFVAISTGADADVLVLSDQSELMIAQPWSLLTYAFTHRYAVHFAINLALLLAAGCVYEHFTNSLRVATAYIFGALGGSLSFELVSKISTGVWHDASLTGASAAILAVCVALVFDKTVRWRHTRPLRYVLAIYMLFNLSELFGDNSGGAISHFGGIVAGCIFALIVNRRAANKVATKDPLISKIEQSGYASLSDDERARLFKQSTDNS